MMQHNTSSLCALGCALLLVCSAAGAAGETTESTTSQEVSATQATLGTAFTYQGRLLDGGNPANGSYDFEFELFDDVAAGNQVGGTVRLEDVTVTDGLFTVNLDFGGTAFTGDARYLAVGVRPGSSTDAFTALDPRQRVAPAPYALALPGVFTRDGSVGVGTTSPGARLDVVAASTSATGVLGRSGSGSGVHGVANTGIGVFGDSSARGVVGTLGGTSCAGTYAVGGCTADQVGVLGRSDSGIGVFGNSTARAVVGTLGGSSCPGTYAVGGCAGSSGGIGVVAASDTGVGLHATSNTNRAVEGFSGNGIGVIGDSTTRAVIGTLGRVSCPGTYAVGGCGGTTGDGVVARTSGGVNATAIRAINESGLDIFVGESSGARRARIGGEGKGFFNGGTQLGGADFAESMPVGPDGTGLEPGDVLIIDTAHPGAVAQARTARSRLVAGVYSTAPSVLSVGRHHIDDALDGEVPVAIAGIVPTKVTAENGSIHTGDLLVTSSTPGHAMKAAPITIDGVEIFPAGTILGKALAPLAEGTGVISVLVMLQ